MQTRKKDYGNKDQFLWTDWPDATAVMRSSQKKLATRPDVLAHFIEYGFAIVPKAVSPAAIDRFVADLNAAIDREDPNLPMTFWDTDENGAGIKYQEPVKRKNVGKNEAKILDVHVKVPSSQNLIFAPVILAFLNDVFRAEPVAFQTLYFENGSQQGAHQDTAFVYTDPAYHFVASWIALEDITPGSGELFYYPKSQKLDDLIFATGTKALRPGDPDGPQYSQLLEKVAEASGLKRQTFMPKRGDVLFWASDLIHGGEPRQFDKTRRSLVTHYCPRTAIIPYARHTGAKGTRLDSGGWVIGQY